MDIVAILNTATLIMATIGPKSSRTEEEFLLYTQACQMLTELLRKYREMWEEQFGELENPTE